MYRIATGRAVWAYVNDLATAQLWHGRGRRVQCNHAGLWLDWTPGDPPVG